jgi:hypothetical protein
MAIAASVPVLPNQKKQCCKIARFTDAPCIWDVEHIEQGMGGSESQSEQPEGDTNVLYTHRELNHFRLVAQSLYRPFYSDSQKEVKE